MKKTQKNTFFSKNLAIFLPLIVTAICCLFAAFNLFSKIESRLYDIMLGFSKEPESADNIVLIDIEDKSLNEIGTWPWTRDILGDVILRMHEYGAAAAVFDIEYLSPSSISASENIDSITTDAFAKAYSGIEDAVSTLADGFSAGAIDRSEATEAGRQIMDNSVTPVMNDMYESIFSGLHRDNDEYFARTVQFFGNTSLTINTRDTQTAVSEEDAEYAAKRFLFTNVEDKDNLINIGNEYTASEEGETVTRGFVPAIRKIISHASGAGFTNVVVDKDGTRRRVELLNQKEDGLYTGQLAFAPLMRALDVQHIRRTSRTLVLEDALLPGAKSRTNITIPLDAHGRMLISWLHAPYTESFRHVAVFNFKYMDYIEADIQSALNELLALSVRGQNELSEADADFISNASYLLEQYAEILSAKEWLLAKCEGFDSDSSPINGGIQAEDYAEYYALREDYFTNVQDFAEALMSMESTASIPVSAELYDNIALYAENTEALKEMLSGAFCIIGNSATGSTDLGVTPFQKRYANLGTHANVANTILQQDFITCIDVWWGIALCALSALAVIFLTRSKATAKKSIYGLIYLFVPLALLFTLMVSFKIYVPIFIPFLLVAATYLAEVALAFIITERDKQLLRRGMDSYVSPDVVDEIVKNPSLMQLGGTNKNMTALFSDVRTFSGFTECINREEGEQHGAVRLVKILNGYLGMLSDAIMEQRGTIDKYVGDEIVSFFGAPINNPLHAFAACVAGIRMKQAEDRYNEEHAAELPIHPVTKTPFLLKSRVGINTGDMVVGNMGTEKKLNYTIMGNNVNLASRLEGTNKAYDSWIMASESTWLQADSGPTAGLLVAKQLDCVKVINVEKPVQIYSIIGLRDELLPEQVEAAELFNKGMEWYLKGRETPLEPKNPQDFEKAKYFFEQAYQCYHTFDQQDKGYISTERKMSARCDAFLANGLPRDENGKLKPWDGVYTMTSK